MSELEQRLRVLAGELDWPATPPLVPRLEQRSGRAQWPWRRLWPIVALVVVGVAVALSVPAARSAILRVLHLGGVIVEQVGVLPPAQERPLGSDLGPAVTRQAAAAALGVAVRLPKLEGVPTLHLRDGVVSVLLAAPRPVLLSELRADVFLIKKIAGSATNVRSLTVGKAPALWIAGARNVLALPAAPRRLAGNVLIWEMGSVTYRLEGRALSKTMALKLASEIDGT